MDGTKKLNLQINDLICVDVTFVKRMFRHVIYNAITGCSGGFSDLGAPGEDRHGAPLTPILTRFNRNY